MGLPEIVDLARNFAVMVRVQGPDPKGLKMRRHAFHHYNSGETTLSASGVLMPTSLIDPAMAKQNFGDIDASLIGSHLVLSVASVVEPFLSPEHREDISRQAKYELVNGSRIDIMVEGKMAIEHSTNLSGKEAPHWLSAKLLTLVEIPVAAIAVQSLIEASAGASGHGWEVGWSLASYSNGRQLMDTFEEQVRQSSMHSRGDVVGEESSNPSLMGKSTTRIALLGVPSMFLKDSPSLSISHSNKKGDLLLAMGSPFGVLSPAHFFNSISTGSIANCYPATSSQRTLLMADIRCLPGMEGSPVFGENAQLIGMLTRPLRQRTSGAEIQLVIPWEVIAASRSYLLNKEPQNEWKWNQDGSQTTNAVGKTTQTVDLNLDKSFNHVHGNSSSRCSPPSTVEKAMASVCLITIDNGAWASGVLLNKEGLILTNAHLLEPWRFRKAASGEKKSEVIFISSNSKSQEDDKFGSTVKSWEMLSTNMTPTDLSVSDEHEGYKFHMANKIHRNIRVRLDNEDPWIWVNVRVLYVSQGALDIALLQLDFVPEKLCPIVVDFTCPIPGSAAYIIGHGLFGPRRDFFPSACRGVVAKVVQAKRSPACQSGSKEDISEQVPAMIETTAAVHPGGSGGAVVNSDGHLIGLVTSNARHGGGMIIPHLNFSIPCAAMEPIFKFSKDMQNSSLLADLDRPNESLSSVWALMPPISPKPDPSPRNLPHFLPGENMKETKGSRFAKFMAERNELLKKTPESGKVKGPFAKFPPSKL